MDREAVAEYMHTWVPRKLETAMAPRDKQKQSNGRTCERVIAQASIAESQRKGSPLRGERYHAGWRATGTQWQNVSGCRALWLTFLASTICAGLTCPAAPLPF
eukprot:2724458-Pleurochrysis_carterae.AAC.2